MLRLRSTHYVGAPQPGRCPQQEKRGETMVDWKEVMKKVRSGGKLTPEEKEAMMQTLKKKKKGIYIRAKHIRGLTDEQREIVKDALIRIARVFKRVIAPSA